MVFVRKSAGRSGATKVQLAERRDGRNVILEHVGTARTDAELAVLMAEARRRLRPGQDTLDLPFAGQRGDDRAGVIVAKRSTVLWQVLSAAYSRLGLDDRVSGVPDAAFRDLVLARVVEPTSKADSVRVLDELGVPHASLRSMFRALTRAAATTPANSQQGDSQQGDSQHGDSQQGGGAGDGYRDRVAAACFAHAACSGDVSLCLYDVTTLYFEAEKEDDLRKVGYSKERRVDPQIVVGLLVDRGGFPLEIGCWEGNHAETATILPTVRAFQERHNLVDMVVVADAGMLSAGNLAALDEAGLRFIVGSRVTKAPGDLASHFRWHGDAFVDGQVIDTLTPRRATAPARAENDPATRAEPVWDPATHQGSWRAVWAYSRKRAVRDGVTLTAQENRAKAVIAGEKAAKTPRFVKTLNGTRSLDEAALARARRLAGLKGYVTNIPAETMPAREVITSYHELWHVEASFRMSKTDLRARPIFHHTKDAIQAHLTIVFAALAVARYLQDATGFSIRKIIKTLRPLQQITIHVAGHDLTAEDPLTPDAQTILTALGLTN